MCWQWLLDLLRDSTFWTAVGALATLLASLAILYAARQFRFEAWNKCQDIFVDKDFTTDRRSLILYLDQESPGWTTDDLAAARRICGKMDELCRLASFFGKREMIKIWGDPIGKSWGLLSAIVQLEREATSWQEGWRKWNAFEKVGSKSAKTLPKDKQERLEKLDKEFGEWAATVRDKRKYDAP